MASDRIRVTMDGTLLLNNDSDASTITYVTWCEERLCNVRVLQSVHFSNLVY
jgi:hypothetical protein